jgi:hypothetical protein
MGPGTGAVIADGFIVSLNLYDNQIYCYGKGPSATTVTAPDTVPSLGSSVTITGTVTDQSAGAKKLPQYPEGAPAMSDADQEAWMEYLYMDQGIPTNAKGVEVTLDAIDPNNNFIHIGTVTSDISGHFGYTWKPEVPGTYQIIATFHGSAAYYSSFSETYMGVGEAPTTPTTIEYPQPIDNTMTIVGVGIAMIIAVAIVGILLLRKKP